jgi:diacylglycerol kinase
MRVHVVAGILAGAFAAAAPVLRSERLLILLCVALVISAEAANTALEALVDLHGGPPSEPARLAKDAAAGAVLVLAVASVALFAVVLAGSWRRLFESWRDLVIPSIAGLGVAVAAGLNLAVPRAFPWLTRGLGVAGVILVTLLAFRAACPPCALVPAALLGLALAAGDRMRDADRQ